MRHYQTILTRAVRTVGQDPPATCGPIVSLSGIRYVAKAFYFDRWVNFMQKHDQTYEALAPMSDTVPSNKDQTHMKTTSCLGVEKQKQNRDNSHEWLYATSRLRKFLINVSIQETISSNDDTAAPTASASANPAAAERFGAAQEVAIRVAGFGGIVSGSDDLFLMHRICGLPVPEVVTQLYGVTSPWSGAGRI